MGRIKLRGVLAIMLMAVIFIFLFGTDDCDECYSPEALRIKLIIAGITIIGIALYSTSRYKKFESMIFDIANQPLLETNEATTGVSFAAEGIIVSDNLVTSYFEKIPCIYYRSVLERYSKQGKHSKWVIDSEHTEQVPFFLQDERGRLAIDPSGIDMFVSGDNTVNIFRSRLRHKKEKQMYSEIDFEVIVKEKKIQIEGRKGKFRKSEYVLRPKSSAFVYGYVTQADNRLVLSEHDRDPLIISRKSQQEFVSQFYKGKILLAAVYPFVLLGIAMILLSLLWSQYIGYKAALFVFILSCIACLLHAIVAMYNRLILLRNRARNSLSNIEGELKRRYDLLPRIESVTAQFAGYEREVQGILAGLRSMNMQNPLQIAAHTDAHTKLEVLVEAYPEVKSSQLFLDAMIQFTDTEERIAYSRSFYNSAVRQYNSAIQQFPAVVVARICLLKPLVYISLDN